MKKICICVIILLAICSKALAIPVYNTITPINLTISTFNHMQGSIFEDFFTEAIHHFAVGVYEMTNGAHRLGRVKIVQRGTLSNREFMHIKRYT